MTIQAIVSEITSIKPHLNADRLQVAIVAGTSCIVGLESKVGDLGLLIPEGAALSREFCLANELYLKHPD